MTNNYSEVKSGRIDQFVIFKLEQVIKKYRQIASESLKRANSNLTVDQWIVLKQISEMNGTSQIEIARSTIKDAPTTTRILDQLIGKNLIIKQLDPEDRRQYMVFITDKGKRLITQIMPVVVEYRSKSLDGIPQNDLAQLQKTLDKILANLKSFQN